MRELKFGQVRSVVQVGYVGGGVKWNTTPDVSKEQPQCGDAEIVCVDFPGAPFGRKFHLHHVVFVAMKIHSASPCK